MEHEVPAPPLPAGQSRPHSAGHSSAAGPSEAAKIYICRMHPDVIRSKPGTCPICGMELVEKEPRK